MQVVELGGSEATRLLEVTLMARDRLPQLRHLGFRGSLPSFSHFISLHTLEKNMDDPPDSNTHLTWSNVGFGFSFVVFDAVISRAFGLGVGVPLLTAAVRCVVQLAIMALVLQEIFEAENPWGVAGLACETLQIRCPRKLRLMG